MATRPRPERVVPLSDGTSTHALRGHQVDHYGIVFAYFVVGAAPSRTSDTNSSLGVRPRDALPMRQLRTGRQRLCAQLRRHGANLARPRARPRTLLCRRRASRPRLPRSSCSTTRSATLVFHDGVLCAGGALTRLRGRAASSARLRSPTRSGTARSRSRSADRLRVGSGARRYYAAWYRNASTTYCPPATANVTNGWGDRLVMRAAPSRAALAGAE
jgi:hypothetical protein